MEILFTQGILQSHRTIPASAAPFPLSPAANFLPQADVLDLGLGLNLMCLYFSSLEPFGPFYPPLSISRFAEMDGNK